MSDEKVSIEFVSRQLDRVLTRLGAIEDQITVLTGMAIRHDGALTGLATEFRGFLDARLAQLRNEIVMWLVGTVALGTFINHWWR